jgi:hypothetical protein
MKDKPTYLQRVAGRWTEYGNLPETRRRRYQARLQVAIYVPLFLVIAIASEFFGAPRRIYLPLGFAASFAVGFMVSRYISEQKYPKN